MKKKNSIILFIAILSIPFSLFAETIVLKSGKQIEGKILEKTDEYVRIDFMGVALSYFYDQIETIDGVKPISAKKGIVPIKKEYSQNYQLEQASYAKSQKRCEQLEELSKKIEKGVTTEKDIIGLFDKTGFSHEEGRDEYFDDENHMIKVPPNQKIHSYYAFEGREQYDFIVLIDKTTGVVLDYFIIYRSNGIASSMIDKPVIYLYPSKEQKISVRLEYQGKIIVSYPKYDETFKGWEVVAYPGGRIVNLSDGKEYSYLFWEGLPTVPVSYDFSKGFVVKSEDTVSFLQNTLSLIGLSPREYNEFIVYWLPQMQNNKYNLIHFATKEYEESVKLDIVPKPDAILRVFMAFKPLNDKINIEPQEIKPFKREGFTVVEWGGTELK